MKTSVILLHAISALALAACAEPLDRDTDDRVAATQSGALVPHDRATANGSGTLAPRTGTNPSPASRAEVLTLEGLADLVIGQPVPAGSRFAERGAQISETCRMVSSPDHPGVYAITENDQVRRITVSERSAVGLAEGIGVGATVADVLAAFPGFRSTPHKYLSAPGRYLTQPGKDSRLRFEIGENGRVSLIHVGLMPQLGYVEGCA